jgi:hypothetical protein
MPIDLDEGAERDDLAPAHPLTPSQRLAAIAEILAAGVRRWRDDTRRMGEFGPHQEREDCGLEPSGPVRLDRPLQGG